MNRAIFLDRDGVIIENVDTYVRSWSDVSILPGSLEALTKLKDTGYKIIIVTNQSAVGRGIISLDTARQLSGRLVASIEAAGGRIDDVFLCPHGPSDGCDCRKPKPGLFLQAAARYSLDLRQSLMVGDALTDIEAGRNAGVGMNVLVRTGRGAGQLALFETRSTPPFPVFDRLTDVVDALFAGLLSQPPAAQVNDL